MGGDPTATKSAPSSAPSTVTPAPKTLPPRSYAYQSPSQLARTSPAAATPTATATATATTSTTTTTTTQPAARSEQEQQPKVKDNRPMSAKSIIFGSLVIAGSAWAYLNVLADPLFYVTAVYGAYMILRGSVFKSFNGMGKAGQNLLNGTVQLLLGGAAYLITNDALMVLIMAYGGINFVSGAIRGGIASMRGSSFDRAPKQPTERQLKKAAAKEAKRTAIAEEEGRRLAGQGYTPSLGQRFGNLMNRKVVVWNVPAPQPAQMPRTKHTEDEVRRYYAALGVDPAGDSIETARKRFTTSTSPHRLEAINYFEEQGAVRPLDTVVAEIRGVPARPATPSIPARVPQVVSYLSQQPQTQKQRTLPTEQEVRSYYSALGVNPAGEGIEVVYQKFMASRSPLRLPAVNYFAGKGSAPPLDAAVAEIKRAQSA